MKHTIKQVYIALSPSVVGTPKQHGSNCTTSTEHNTTDKDTPNKLVSQLGEEIMIEGHAISTEDIQLCERILSHLLSISSATISDNIREIYANVSLCSLHKSVTIILSASSNKEADEAEIQLWVT